MISEMNIEAEASCGYDYLSFSSPSLEQDLKYCGSADDIEEEKKVIAAYGSLEITFHTDGSTNLAGFITSFMILTDEELEDILNDGGDDTNSAEQGLFSNA